MVKYEFVIELTNMSLNELNDVDSNRSSDQRPMAASLKQQQSTSSNIYCAFYWTTGWLNSMYFFILSLSILTHFQSIFIEPFIEPPDDSSLYYLIFSFWILTHFQAIFILPLLNHRMIQFHTFWHFFSSLLLFLFNPNLLSCLSNNQQTWNL